MTISHRNMGKEMKHPEVNRPKHWAGKMARWKRMLAARPDKLSLLPEDRPGKEKNQLLQIAPRPPFGHCGTTIRIYEK